MRKIMVKYRGWIRLIAFIVGIAIINSILCYFLVPAGNYSRWVQHDAVTPENTYDLISFGASESMRIWDSKRADEILGTHSFNMGSSATYLDGGIYATFQDTMLHQSPERVIFILGRYEMASDEESPLAYIAVAPYLSSFRVRAEYYCRTIKMGGAIKRLFPWTEYHVNSLYELSYNFIKKGSKQYRQYDPELLEEGDIVYRGQGFCPFPYSPESIISYDNMNKKLLNPTKDGKFRDIESTFVPQKVETLKKMISYCEKNGCDVTVVLSPVPITSIFSTPRYNSYSKQLKELVEQAGASFYDLNFAKKELYDPQLDDFYDATHTNERGGTRATEAICRILQMKERGEDLSGLFYDTWESYLESIDYAAAVYMIAEEKDSDICATAYCVTGTKTIPEFKFVLHNMKNDSEEVIRDFSVENTTTVSKKLLSEDSIVLRVYARAAGEENDQHIRYSDYQVKK